MKRYEFKNDQWWDTLWVKDKRVVSLRVHASEEVHCSICIHVKVCGRSMDKRCGNYEWGTSEGRYDKCDACLHRRARFDHESPVSCFQCQDFVQSATPKVRVLLGEKYDILGDAVAFDGDVVYVHVLDFDAVPTNEIRQVPPAEVFRMNGITMECDPLTSTPTILSALPKPEKYTGG